VEEEVEVEVEVVAEVALVVLLVSTTSAPKRATLTPVDVPSSWRSIESRYAITCPRVGTSLSLSLSLSLSHTHAHTHTHTHAHTHTHTHCRCCVPTNVFPRLRIYSYLTTYFSHFRFSISPLHQHVRFAHSQGTVAAFPLFFFFPLIGFTPDSYLFFFFLARARVSTRKNSTHISFIYICVRIRNRSRRRRRCRYYTPASFNATLHFGALLRYVRCDTIRPALPSRAPRSFCQSLPFNSDTLGNFLFLLCSKGRE
jgi:hypothetical protein